jgi:hypothetical protein
MKTLYGLKIYAHTPENKYDYTHHTVFTTFRRASNVRARILKFHNENKFITRIEIINLILDKGRK